MEKVLEKYRRVLSKTHEELAKELAATQKEPFTLPLTSVQIMILQEFVDVVVPDINNKVGQLDDTDPPYFSLSTSPYLIVDHEWWARAFSYFFAKPVIPHSSPLGWANKRVHFFRLQYDDDKVYNLRGGKES